VNLNLPHVGGDKRSRAECVTSQSFANLGKWCGRVRAILTQNDKLSYGHLLYQKGFGRIM
jgi:hypothetical protein